MSDQKQAAPYAVIRTGGKQYRLAVGDKLQIEKIEEEVGKTISCTDILAISDGSGLKVGKPLVENASVELEVVKHLRSRKIKVFKKKRRQNYRRTNSHRQHLTEVIVKAIHSGANKPAPQKKAEPKKPAAAAEKKTAEKEAPAKKPAAKKAAATATKKPKKADKPAKTDKE